MKKGIQYLYLLFFVSAIFLVSGCHSGNTTNTEDTAYNKKDTATIPPATDSMPVVNPGKFDSSGVIKTPPTNDHNAIMPDTTKKSR